MQTSCLFGDELGRPIFAHGTEAGRVQERGEHVETGVGDQRLAGRGYRDGGKTWVSFSIEKVRPVLADKGCRYLYFPRPAHLFVVEDA